jgi:sodium/potassium-transporting ATPase subunit alpha
MKIQQLSIADAIASLHSRPEGLSSAAARSRLKEFGPNRVHRIRREPLAARFLKELTGLFSAILWIAAALALIAEWSDPGQGMARLAVAIIAVILVSSVFSFWQEYRAERTLAALQKLLPQEIRTQRDNRLIRLPADELVPGDIVLLEQGDNVAADCRVIEAFALRVSNATITGESSPQSRDAGPSQEEDLLGSRNIVFAGTSIIGGQGKAIVFATGMHTEFGKIARLTQESGQAVSPLRREIARLSRVIIVLALVIGIVFFAVGRLIGIPFWDDFIFAIGIIVAMVPEGLLPTLTLALVLATQRMAKRNVLLRHLPSVEALGCATVICTDKTGTLTENRMAVNELYLGGNRLRWSRTTLQPERLIEFYRMFFLTASLCHSLKMINRDGSDALAGDPMDIALVEMSRSALNAAPDMKRVDELPFDAERMRQSVVCRTPEGDTLYCKGAPECLLPLCTRVLIDGAQQDFSDAQRVNTVNAQEAMASRGLRVIALAYRVLGPQHGAEALEADLVFAGLAGLEDPPRPEVAAAIRKCREAGVRVIMVTGDHPRTASAIAREIGLIRSDAPRLVTGDELSHLSIAQLRLVLDAPEIIFARVAADQKMRIVDALQQKGHVVAVTGDGVNDAPALKIADIGIAMGLSGTAVAKEAADMILLDDNFASIVNAIEEGRAVYENIRKFLTYILSHNVPELIPYLAFALFRIPLPLTPIQVLAIDMGTDSLTALGLGVEKPDPQVMQRPPRPQHERLLNWPLALRAYLFLGVIEALAAMAAFFFVLLAGGWHYGEIVLHTDSLYLQATTACLSAIIVMQIVNVFNCRSAVRSTLATGFNRNPLIVAGVILELALIVLIDYTSWGNALLGTAPITGNVWLFVLPFAAALLLLEEVRKSFARRTPAPTPIS